APECALRCARFAMQLTAADRACKVIPYRAPNTARDQHPESARDRDRTSAARAATRTARVNYLEGLVRVSVHGCSAASPLGEGRRDDSGWLMAMMRPRLDPSVQARPSILVVDD